MINVILARKRVEAQDICSFEFLPADREQLPPFGAGAHIAVCFEGGLIRQYSLCNHPDECNRYLLGVLLDPQSRGGSQAMHALQEGAKLCISEPRNLFPLNQMAKRTLLFAGGIGITPIICMAERLAQTGAEFELHYSARSISHAAFVERLRKSEFSGRTHLHFDDGESTQKLDAASVLAAPDIGDHLYVCGPSGFIAHIIDGAHAQGWAEDRIHREYFSVAPITGANDGSFEIQIFSSGRILTVPANKSVAAILLEAGIEVSLSCEQGICGTCLTPVIEGEPDHRDAFMTEGERACNNQFTPCCSRAKTARLVLGI